MGYDPIKSLRIPMKSARSFLKFIPHVDDSRRIRELLEYVLDDSDLKGAWTGPGRARPACSRARSVAELPIPEILSATHIIADLTLGPSKVIDDYLR